MSIQQGFVVEKDFATNASETERMRLLLDRVAETEPGRAVEGESKGMDKSMGEEVAVDTAGTNIGQSRLGCKSHSLEIL